MHGKRAESGKQVPKAQHTWQGGIQLALRKVFKYSSRGIAWSQQGFKKILLTGV